MSASDQQPKPTEANPNPAQSYKKYLADGVYADFDGHYIVLTTEQGDDIATNTIRLENTTLRALYQYVQWLKEQK